MAFTNSPLVSYTKISPNRTKNRNQPIDRITPHCVVGQCSVETLGNVFLPESRQASSNYGIGVDGRVGMYCEEKDRSWCSSSGANDHRAITIECASDTSEPYAMNEKVYKTLIDLCTDICKRNGKTKLLWLGDKDKTLAYVPKANEMVITVHRWFANKSCPGAWLYGRLSDLANKVTANLNPAQPTEKVLYRVQIGAFSVKANADAMLQKAKAAGFTDAYITSSAVTTPAPSTPSAPKEQPKPEPAPVAPKKTVDEIAKEVINGKWGNGADRKNRLTAAGYNYSEIQARVNAMLK